LIPTAPTGSNVVGVQVAGNAEGDSIAAWSVVPNGSNIGTEYVALRAAHKAWRAPVAIPGVELPSGPGGAVPSVSIAPNGRVALAWGVVIPPNPATSHVTVATGNATTGSWASPVAIAAGGLPRVAIDSAGALAAVWSVPVTNFSGYDIMGAVAADGASWTTPGTLVSIGVGSESDHGQVTISESGHAFASVDIHVGPGAYTAVVESAGPSGAWSGFSRNSGAPTSVTLASNAAGDALALRTGPPTLADSYDAVPRPALAVAVHGAWLMGRHRLRWTITVRNRGAATAAGVQLKVAWINARLVQRTPTGRRTSASGLAWLLAPIAPGHSRSVTVIVARTSTSSAPVLRGQSSATGIPTVTFTAPAPG
jgi:hypothetical protein